MANLMLTTKCNRHCSYCFAGNDKQQINELSVHINRDFFEKYLEYLSRSDIHQARFLGGEPTLHPEFSDYLKLAYDRGFSILIFTNGFIPDTAMKAILRIPEDRINVLVNITPSCPSDRIELTPRLITSLQKLGLRAYPGYTISHPDTQALFDIIRVIEQTDISRSIRLGLAHPSDWGNDSLSPKQYRRVAEGLMPFFRKARNHSINVELDCGFVRCMFTEDDVREMEEMGTNFAWRCNPVIDILYDGSAVPCFPLSGSIRYRNVLDSRENDVFDFFTNELSTFRIAGVFPECSVCLMRATEKCSGGCLAGAINRMHKRPMVYEMPKFEEVH